MARYKGPKRKLERREQTSLFGTEAWRKRPGVPGQHPIQRSRPSEYAVQFREKQKVKRTYGLLEKSFRKVVAQASKSTGNTGTRMLQLLETRLDNIVFRLGYAKTRNQARQFVTHAHVKVNGKTLSIPSYQVQVNDTIEVDKKILDSDFGKSMKADLEKYQVPAWLSKGKTSGKLVGIPARSDLDQSISERLIVEYYSMKGL